MSDQIDECRALIEVTFGSYKDAIHSNTSTKKMLKACMALTQNFVRVISSSQIVCHKFMHSSGGNNRIRHHMSDSPLILTWRDHEYMRSHIRMECLNTMRHIETSGYQNGEEDRRRSLTRKTIVYIRSYSSWVRRSALSNIWAITLF